jgi:hypothetical protein
MRNIMVNPIKVYTTKERNQIRFRINFLSRKRREEKILRNDDDV